jgi:hypothetical protein
MRELTQTFRTLIAAKNLQWKLQGGKLTVGLGRTQRSQVIKLDRVGDDYVFSSTILGAAKVTRNDQYCREVARLAWERNAVHDIVTFAFDRTDRLVGLVRCPVSVLRPDALVLFITTLARECDRFEYVLTGADRF